MAALILEMADSADGAHLDVVVAAFRQRHAKEIAGAAGQLEAMALKRLYTQAGGHRPPATDGQFQLFPGYAGPATFSVPVEKDGRIVHIRKSDRAITVGELRALSARSEARRRANVERDHPATQILKRLGDFDAPDEMAAADAIAAADAHQGGSGS